MNIKLKINESINKILNENISSLEEFCKSDEKRGFQSFGFRITELINTENELKLCVESMDNDFYADVTFHKGQVSLLHYNIEFFGGEYDYHKFNEIIPNEKCNNEITKNIQFLIFLLKFWSDEIQTGKRYKDKELKRSLKIFRTLRKFERIRNKQYKRKQISYFLCKLYVLCNIKFIMSIMDQTRYSTICSRDFESIWFDYRLYDISFRLNKSYELVFASSMLSNPMIIKLYGMKYFYKMFGFRK